MTLEMIVGQGLENARAARPAVDRDEIERTLRCANRSLGRRLGRIEWLGSYEAYIVRTAEAIADGWKLDAEYPFAGPPRWFGEIHASDVGSLETLSSAEEAIWWHAASMATAVTERKRFPVDLSSVPEPQRASGVARDALNAAATVEWLECCVEGWDPEEEDENVRWESLHEGGVRWDCIDPVLQAHAELPFLTEIASCFALGLFAATSLRRGDALRTLLIERPRLRFRGDRLHADDEPAVVWPDGSERWYWDEVAVPIEIAEAREELTAEAITAIGNQELRRVVLDRIGWDRFMKTADATLVAQDDFGKLWATGIELDDEPVALVEVVNATAELDGTHRRYFLRVPPTVRTARAAVAWTFGFDKVTDYAIAAQS
jgi:hypothetical protein